jgi:carbon monoxide dehydrogenase subunit G
MAFTVDVEVDETFEADAKAEDVFAVLADVPFSVSHFPKVDQLIDEGGGVYRWEMEKLGLDKYFIQTVYACKYVADPEKLTVKWTPVKKVGNAQVTGKWTIKPIGEKKTRLTLSTRGTLELPFPSLAKILLGGFVRSEFEGLIRGYINNLQETFKKGKKPGAKKTAARKKA